MALQRQRQRDCDPLHSSVKVMGASDQLSTPEDDGLTERTNVGLGLWTGDVTPGCVRPVADLLPLGTETFWVANDSHVFQKKISFALL